MQEHDVKQRLLEAILPHVPFDGWSEAAFDMACSDVDVGKDVACFHCPKGAVDLAILYHRLGDQELKASFLTKELQYLRYSEKVAHAIFMRLQIAKDRDLVRKASTLFVLPHLAGTGSKLVWETADAIWTALGDTSQDVNWYSKRMTLSAVYASCVLFWLGDESEDWAETKAFIDRRIADVMRFGSSKAQMQKSKILGPLMAAMGRPFAGIKAPSPTPPNDLPGYWNPDHKL